MVSEEQKAAPCSTVRGQDGEGRGGDDVREEEGAIFTRVRTLDFK